MTFDPDEIITPKTTSMPEHRLWATCLLDGVRCALVARRARLTSKRPNTKIEFDEWWLYDEESQHIGSFNWICHLFEQDPNKVRSRVLMKHRELIKDAA